MKAARIIFIALFIGPLYLSAQTTNADKGISKDFQKKATQYLEQRVAVNKFSGVVLVAVDGKPIFTKAYGMANHEFGILNSPETKFRIGSAGKQFASSAILLLEQRGKLKLTDSVSKHLPDWPKAWSEITIHHLLSHTSGLPALSGTAPFTDVSNLISGFYNPSIYKSVKDLYKPGEELKPPDFKPGDRFAYSNFGYIILGFIVEKASGKSFCDFLQQEFFAPLNMRSTGCENPDMVLKQRASGYILRNDSIFNSGFVDLRFESAAGGEYASVADLLQWNNSLDANKILSSEQTRKLFTPNKENYGYGWWIESRFNQPVQWHRGTVSGFAAIMARYPQKKVFITVLSNIVRAQVKSISTELAAIAFNEHYEIPRIRKEINVDSNFLDEYTGTYYKEGTIADSFALKRKEGSLTMEIPPGNPLFKIFPEAKDKFFATWGEFYLYFERENGKIVRVVIAREGDRVRYPRKN